MPTQIKQMHMRVFAYERWSSVRERPWGTKPQLWESVEISDCKRAEAIALCDGNIDIKQLNSTGNLLQ